MAEMLLRLSAALLLLTSFPALAGYGEGLAAYGRADYATAAREFAAAGDPESQYMLGRLHAMGFGVPQDLVQAWVLSERAARHGHRQAAEARDAVAAILTPAQRESAQRLVDPLPPPPAPAPPAPPSPPSAAAASPLRPVILFPRPGGVVQSAHGP
jgi:hypothetical protein